MYIIYIYIYIYIDAFAQVLFACSIVWLPSICWGVQTPTKFSERRGDLTEFQFLEEGYLEREGELFKAGLQCLHKQ